MSEQSITEATSSIAWHRPSRESNAGLYDAPWDFTRPAKPLSRKRAAHRFPAAIHLRPARAREERALALQALQVIDEGASSRIGIAVGFLTGIGVTAGALFATDSIRTPLPWWLMAAVGGALVLALGALIGMLRQHSLAHEQLSQRALLYELRLAELEEQRRAALAADAAAERLRLAA
ncbi:MAG: hypothetical protein ACTHJJ_00855 [Intrasporangium sp.]|uniref:hypothetical protein n=1 Tax=Intrasporangium sp. TaxID=1925024 RepID=UPI003F80B8DA